MAHPRNEYQKEYRARRRAELASRMDIPHGSIDTYKNWGCRCDPCQAANTVYQNKDAKTRRVKTIEASRKSGAHGYVIVKRSR
jgi:hypothetical protein